MSKRSLASPRTPAQRKKSKLAPDQYQLDAFFSKSPTKSPVVVGPPATSSVKGQSTEAFPIAQPSGISRDSPSLIIDVDLLDDIQTLPGPPSPERVPSDLPLAGASVTFGNGAIQSAPVPYATLANDPLDFTPNIDTWPSGSAVPYAFLAHTLTEVSETRSRIKILNSLTNALRTIIRHHPPSLAPSLYLLSNALSPPYAPVELGIGPSLITKAIQHVSGLSSAALKRLYTSTGDAGDVAFEAKSKVRTLIPHPPLSIVSVYSSLVKITRCRGQGASNQKQQIIEKLLLAAKGEEVRFLVRTLSQNLRVGAVRTSILTALARAIAVTPPETSLLDVSASPYHITSELLGSITPMTGKGKASTSVPDGSKEEITTKFKAAEALIRQVYAQHPNYDSIVAALLEAGLDGLTQRVSITVGEKECWVLGSRLMYFVGLIGIPILPSLGSPTRSLSEIYELLGASKFTAEFKYDGQRAQIHARRQGDGQIITTIFSRHLENMTSKYPDVVSLVETILRAHTEITSFIMDAEIVAIDTRDGSLKTFQELSNRARKDVLIHDVQVSVAVYAFDLMYHNDQSLLKTPFRERRALLRTEFPPLLPETLGIARFHHVESCESEAGKEAVQEFWERAVESRCEGLMIKLLDVIVQVDKVAGKGSLRKKPLPASYEPDKRTSAWLKLKKDYVNGLGDSLDLVPIGAWHGNGRKASWWSPILLGVWDDNLQRAVAVCKCMSGFTDAFYKSLTERYQVTDESEVCSRQSKWNCEFGGFKPEVFFKPQEVWEIRGADITLSPTSVAALGLVNSSRGLSLRFPRFIRVRDDKLIDQASTHHFLAGMWKSQEAKGVRTTGAENDEGDLVDVEIYSEAEEEEIDDVEQ
ncbi:hypothetical protein HGRIS_002513 [Hohenbuehelia grisea]|uniref:DNA ligase n=1 Tax=Hohenbuehelia grisea TaxID=104357 RepID=A0ABR3JMM0_9AGAR